MLSREVHTSLRGRGMATVIRPFGFREDQDLRAQGHGVAKDAVHAMLGHLMDAFLLSAVPIATVSERQRNSNPRKPYPADPGLIKAFDASGRANLGHALDRDALVRPGAPGIEVRPAYKWLQAPPGEE
jgi:predicted AAA+ superfamily ATPase